MSAFPDSVFQTRGTRRWELSRARYAALGTTLAVLGALSIWQSLRSLWLMWTSDALKSIGMIIPVVSLILILRAWRAIGWRAEGTWWGLPILLIAMVAAQVQEQGVLILVISPDWSTLLPPPAFVLLAYGSGAVLLIGGVRLYRAALFPILLLWFANPVPHAFSLLVDLPLQQASAHIARAFAMGLGHSLTPDHLRLMFTPDFGMFIAPGCNGIRGSITMGFIALIAGYVCRFRWYANAIVVTGAILLGYLFNLARLCLLVLYYIVAVHFPSLQDKAENADYVIGAALFLLATFVLFTIIHHLRDGGSSEKTDVGAAPGGFEDGTQSLTHGRLVTMGLVVLLGLAVVARADVESRRSTGKTVGARFPQRLGNYTLIRTWNEMLFTGKIAYDWAEYSQAGVGEPISIGVSPVLGWHDPLICHSIRGEHPLWQGQLTTATVGIGLTNFSSAFYSDGVSQYLDASTQCSGGSCSEFATDRTHFGFVYSRPNPRALLGEVSEFPIPVLIRAETTDVAMPAEVARRKLTAELENFLAAVKLEDITKP